MTNEKIKRMFDAFYQAKRIRDMLPPLPQGVMPSYIQYLDVIHSLQREKKDIRLSDISDAMNLPRPGVTRTVKEMKAKGYLQKLMSPDDGRVTYISITEKGENLSRKYDQICLLFVSHLSHFYYHFIFLFSSFQWTNSPKKEVP